MQTNQTKTLYFSSILRIDPDDPETPQEDIEVAELYGLPSSADDLFKALDDLKDDGIQYELIENTRDIWARDYMPVGTKKGRYVSFRYEPSYHKNREEIEDRTIFVEHLNDQFSHLKVDECDINLDGGNVVFSPLKNKAIITHRIYEENPECDREELKTKLAEVLDAQIIIIPSYDEIDENGEYEDKTGHADGMVRFVAEDTVICNETGDRLEEEIKDILRKEGIDVIDFPYLEWYEDNNSEEECLERCYINFLETEKYIFLPVFGSDLDDEAEKKVERLFRKQVVRVNISEIAEKGGGLLNCISWECEPSF